MVVKRIVANLGAAAPDEIAAFYRDLFGLETMMDFGWIITLGSGELSSVQMSFASQGGSGTQVPDLSIEVDNLPDVLAKSRAADIVIEYGPVDEPWGVSRFYMRDPAGRLLNVLTHTQS